MKPKPEELPYKPLGYRIATRAKMEELCALVPEQAEALWARWNTRACIPLDEWRRLMAEAKKPKMPGQPIEIVRRVAQQTVEQLAQREAEEAERLKPEKERQHEAWLAHRQAAIDACWSRQIAEREIAKAWRDPCGLWGKPTLASPLND